MPITSLTWTSRQARTQRLQWMQASRLTAIAGWLRSGDLRPTFRKAGGLDAHPLGPLPEPGIRVVGDASRAGWSASSSSMTMRRAVFARSEAVTTFMPAAGLRMQDAASTRSPSISTMQARQLPSAR